MCNVQMNEIQTELLFEFDVVTYADLISATSFFVLFFFSFGKVNKLLFLHKLHLTSQLLKKQHPFWIFFPLYFSSGQEMSF